MKKQSILLFFITFFILSCEKNESLFPSPNQNSNINISGDVSKARKKVSIKDFSVMIPEYFPNDVMEYNPNDFYNIAMNNHKKVFFKIKHIKGNSLKEIFENVLKYYPNIDIYNAKEYQKIFPDLSENEIFLNKENLDKVLDNLMAFDISSAFSQLKGAKYVLSEDNKNARGYISSFDWLNSACTVAVVAAHPRLDFSGLSLAVSDANSKSATYGTPQPQMEETMILQMLLGTVYGVFILANTQLGGIRIPHTPPQLLINY